MLLALLGALVLLSEVVPPTDRSPFQLPDTTMVRDSVALAASLDHARPWGLSVTSFEPHSGDGERLAPIGWQTESSALASLQSRPPNEFGVSSRPGPPAAPPPDEMQLRGLPPDSLVALRIGIVSGTLAATVAGLYVYQRNAWWAEEHRGRFHFHDDGGYSEHLDKVGHFHATYFQSQVVARSLRWSGMSPSQAALWGAVGAWLVQLKVEINDGFSELWGFDIYDVVGNTLGAAYFYTRERVPALDPVVLKFSYWPSTYLVHGIDKPGGVHPPNPVDDYLGHTYWVSLRIHDLLPEPAQPFWPRWLMLAGGVSGDQLYTPEAQRSYYVALDLDLERIVPARTWLAASGLEVLNFLKLPMPAVRLQPRPTFYLVYYGQN